MSTYGRNRHSIANIEQELNDIFDNHPKSQINANGEPVIPAENLLDVLQSFSDLYNGQPLLSDEETSMLQDLLTQNPGLEVTPQILLGFIAEKTKSTTPAHDEERGREEHRRDAGYGYSRSLSSDSDGTSYYPGNQSRPPSRGSMTPSTKSPLDSERRQRSTPLSAAPPSSWAKRPTPTGRRKSDAGSRSDGENGTPAWGRSSSRRRTPSHPASPTTPSHDLSFSPGSPPEHSRPISRPHSRSTHRHGSGSGFNHSTSFDLGYSSPEDTNHTVKTMSRYGFKNYDGSFVNEVSTLPMPRSSEHESDDEDELDAGLVHDRTTASSTVSMEIHERMEALQRNNEELGRKLMEAERTLQNKLMEHETELEETHMRLEELRSELSLSNREEKELRAKDSRNMAQIAALEAEIAKTQKALDSAKATYSSLQKQYQEQCVVSEKYRDDLRRRDETIRTLRENAALYEIETAKWQKEHDTYEERLGALQAELNLALQAHTQLDEQKQENLLLKETIDRMRYEMDEMRSATTSNGLGVGSSGGSSAMNTLSKTLGAELMGKMKWMEDEDEETRDELISDNRKAVETEEDERTEGEDEEDVIQTIITRKRKVTSRARELETLRRTFEEVKEYSDSSTQYDPTLFAVNHGMQTEPERKPVKTSSSIQTDHVSVPVPQPITPLPRVLVEMEIQTEKSQEEPSRSPSPANDASMASSSSTILPVGPPTPKALAKSLDPLDEPPAYNQVHEESADREWRLASELLRKWHQGASANGPFEFEGLRGGISEDALEEWKTLKQELGVECGVIDKIVAASTVNVPSVPSPSGNRRAGKSPLRRSGRFYNIYNTYVYGAGDGTDKAFNSWSFSGLTSQALMVVGASALVLIAISPYMAPQSAVSIPGGATYYDRAAWHSFNSMQAAGEGFAGGWAGSGVAQDGTAAVWNFLGRVGGGAARMARGWPT